MDLQEYQKLQKKQSKIFSLWRKYMNMTVLNLKELIRSGNLTEAQIQNLTALVKLKTASKLNWTDAMYDTAEHNIREVKRLMENPTKNNDALKLHGHDHSIMKTGGDVGRVTTDLMSTDISRKKFVQEWLALFNMSDKELLQFYKWIKDHPEYKIDLRVSQYQIDLSIRGKQLNSKVLSGFANQDILVTLRNKPLKEWTMDDYYYAKDFALLYDFVSKKKDHVSQDNVIRRWKSLGIDFDKVTKQTKREPELIPIPAFEFDNNYTVFHPDFEKWLESVKDGFELTESKNGRRIIHGYIDGRPIFQYNYKDNNFATNEYDIDALPEYFMKPKKEVNEVKQIETIIEPVNTMDKKDTVTLDIPLLIRILELAREDVKSDVELHEIVERLLELKNKETLTMEDYDYIAKLKEQYGEGGGVPKENKETIPTENMEKSQDIIPSPMNYEGLKHNIEFYQSQNLKKPIMDAQTEYYDNVVCSDPSKIADILKVHDELHISKKLAVTLDEYLEHISDEKYIELSDNLKGRVIWDYVPEKYKSYSKTKAVDFVPSPKSENLGKITDYFAGNDDLRPIMRATHFDVEESNIVATDAHRMIIIAAKPDVEKTCDCLMGNRLKKHLKENNLTSPEVINKFLTPDGCFTQDGRYPNYKAVIPREFEYVFSVTTEQITRFVKGQLQLANQQTDVVYFGLKQEGYDFHSFIGFNGVFLLEAMKALELLGHYNIDICSQDGSKFRAFVMVPSGKSRELSYSGIRVDTVLVMSSQVQAEDINTITPIYNLDTNTVMSYDQVRGVDEYGSVPSKMQAPITEDVIEAPKENVSELIQGLKVLLTASSGDEAKEIQELIDGLELLSDEPTQVFQSFVDQNNQITYTVKPKGERWIVEESSPNWEKPSELTFVSEEDAVNYAKFGAGIIKENDPEEYFLRQTEEFANGGNLKTDKEGNYIGDGTFHAPYNIIDFSDYPQIITTISKSETTESVYVTYSNKNNSKSVTCRFSFHLNNAVRFGDQLDGNSADKKEILALLGIIKRVFVPKTNISIDYRKIKWAERKHYEEADLTISEMYELGVGADLSQFKGKVSKGGNYLILGDKVEMLNETVRDAFGTSRVVGNWVYLDNESNENLEDNKVSSNEEFGNGGELTTSEKSAIYDQWKSLVNMSESELKEFYNSEEGKKAGLSSSEAKKLGIDNGRTSARWIMKMKSISFDKWTDEMWKWAKKQISFIKRMSGIKGELYDENGKKTDKHLSLLIWGHNPEKSDSIFANGGDLQLRGYKLLNRLSKENPNWMVDKKHIAAQIELSEDDERAMKEQFGEI